jgi:plasmid stabilization system protein ParE
MPRLGDGPRLHHLAPQTPYRVRLTLEATDDLEQALAARTPTDPARRIFIADWQAALERIAVLPHLARRHHGRLQITALPNSAYRLWYVLDEPARTVIIVGVITVVRPVPACDPMPPLRRAWWQDMPHLDPRLPDPYPLDDATFNPSWLEEDTGWWKPRMPRQTQPPDPSGLGAPTQPLVQTTDRSDADAHHRQNRAGITS